MTASRPPPRPGSIRLDPAQRIAWVDDVPARIGARAFDLLLALVERRGRVVSKSELFDTVWPGLVVEENTLQVHVSALRKCLGPEAIATIPGRGYQFTAPLDAGRELEAGTGPSIAGHAAATAAHNLPVQRTRFIGREAPLAACTRLLERSRVLTVTGIGGCGKTRLALELARRQCESFAHGVRFVDLAPLEERGEVAHAVASAVGARQVPGATPLERLRAFLAGRRVLLVLDNCEHVLDAVTALVDGLCAACPGLAVLATSRDVLGIDGEQVFQLRPLVLPARAGLEALVESEAGRLFIDRARLVLPEFDADPGSAAAIADICRRLDGIALAIELAAARIPMLSAAEISARLDDRFRLLTAGTGALPRHQTLGATLQWSYQSLGAAEQHLLRCLSVFAGGCTLASAARVVGDGVDEHAVLERLTRLHGKSLLQVERDATSVRYRLLETVREYARERLAECGEADAARTRHLLYFVDLARQAEAQIVGPDQGEWLGRLARDQENLVAAHAWCEQAPGGDQAGLQLVWSLRHYWITTDQLDRGLELAQAALARARPGVEAAAHCSAHLAIGQSLHFLGRYDEALSHSQQGLALARQTGSRTLGCIALNHCAQARLALGHPAEAIADYEEASAMAREIGRDAALSSALNGLAEAHRSLGQLVAAEAYYEKAIQVGRNMRNPGSTAPALCNLVRVLVVTGALPRAQAQLLECATITTAAGITAMAHMVLEVAAGLAAAKREPALAARFYGASNALLKAAGRPREPVDAAFVEPLVARSMADLGTEAFGAARAAGEVLELQAALGEVTQWLAGRG